MEIRLVYFSKAICTTLFAALLSGCIAVPYQTSTALPDLSARVPEDLRSSDGDVLVLMQWQINKYQVILRTGVAEPLPDEVSEPVFTKGNGLRAFFEDLPLEIKTNLFIAVGLPALGAGGGGTTPWRTKRLTVLCMTALDGRIITLSIGGSPLVSERLEFLTPQRRDAILLALRTGGNAPFEKVDGPCGISGLVHWDDQTRSKAIHFLERIQTQAPKEEINPVAQIIRRAYIAIDPAVIEPNEAILLVSSRWRGKRYDEPPMFLKARDFDALLEHRESVKGRWMVPLLPSVHSGARAIEATRVEHLCAISGDGRALWWSEDEAAWRVSGEKLVYRVWKDNVLGNLLGRQEFPGPDANCAPFKPEWSSDERRLAIGFVERVKTQEGQSAGIEVMVLDMGLRSGRQYVLEPRFIRAESTLALVEAVKGSLAAREPGSGDSDEIQVCLIGAEGQIVELDNQGESWKERKRHAVTAAWRSDAVYALTRDSQRYGGSYVCNLQMEVSWSVEMRQKAITFLEKLPVREIGPTPR